MSELLIQSCLQSLFCHVKVTIHKFWRLGLQHIGEGARFHPETTGKYYHLPFNETSTRENLKSMFKVQWGSCSFPLAGVRIEQVSVDR